MCSSRCNKAVHIERRRKLIVSELAFQKRSRTKVHVMAPKTTVQRVENARREAREVCSNVKITGRRGIFCSARSPGGRAGRRKNSEKNPANCAAAVVSRARRRLSMPGAAYSAGRAVVFSMTVWTCSLRETQRHSHTDTQRHAHRLSLSQLQPGIVRVRVAKVFWAICYNGSGMDALNRTY